MAESIENAPVMTVTEVAQFLRLAESTVYRLAQDGKLPGKKIGGNWRFYRHALEEWLMRADSTQDYDSSSPE